MLFCSFWQQLCLPSLVSIWLTTGLTMLPGSRCTDFPEAAPQSVGRCYFGIPGERKKPGNAAVHHRYDGAPGFPCARMCERGGKYYPGESGKYPRRYLSNPDSGNWRDQNDQVRIKIRARPAAGIHHTERRNRPRGSFPAME